GHRHLRGLVDAHEVAHVQSGAEVRLVDRVDDAADPVGGLHEEAVVLEDGGDAPGGRVPGDLLGGGDDGRQRPLVQGRVVAGMADVADHFMAHQPDVQSFGDVHAGLHACALRGVLVRLLGEEVCADGEVGQDHPGQLGLREKLVDEGEVGGDVRYGAGGVVSERGQ